MLNITTVVALGLLIVSCSSDDEINNTPQNGAQSECKTCQTETLIIEYCDNGDGTISQGESEVLQELESFDALISELESQGYTCN